MAQTQEVKGVATSITTREGETHVNYRGTDVVSFDGLRVILRSNGWKTNTTKTRMNQASNQFGLNYRVFQKDYEWFVDLPSNEIVPFADGMMFDRFDSETGKGYKS